MPNSRSLRFRIGITFGVLASLLCALFAWAISLAVEHMEQRYIEATLTENLEMVMRERDGSGRSPERSASIAAYAVRRDELSRLPPLLQGLGPGSYEHDDRAEDPGKDLQIAVRDEGAMRYVVVYDHSDFEALEGDLFTILTIGVFVFGGAALWLGAWTADRIVAPISSLTRQIRSLGERMSATPLAVEWGDDEVAELARTFEHYMFRVEELMRREREFTANVSHELRSPIMVASTSVELLLSREDLGEAARAQLTRAARAIRQMTNLTDAFLILGREVDRGMELQPLPVEPALREVIEFRGETARRKNLRLELAVGGSPRVHAPKTAVSVVLDNLVGNALTHTTDGGVSVMLGDGGVTISDTGPGIPADERARIFEREFRGRNAPPGGAGLGLSIVQALCERYGWRVTLESEEGRGTTARLDFAPSPPG
jgi:signal transduction histidine kinase